MGSIRLFLVARIPSLLDDEAFLYGDENVDKLNERFYEQSPKICEPG